MNDVALIAEQLVILQAQIMTTECLAKALLEQLAPKHKLEALETTWINGQRLADECRQEDPTLANALLDALHPTLAAIQVMRRDEL